MRWDPSHQSENVEDRRGQGGAGGGGIFSLVFLLFRHFGVGGVVVGLVIVGGIALFGGGGMLGLSGSAPTATGTATGTDAGKAFVAFVLDDAQKTWTELYRERGKTYQPARLVLFAGRTESGCGAGDAATGPFYCPKDQRVYIDLDFYRALKDRLGAPGDFAQAYVIAHEIGHHITQLEQNLGKGRDEGAEGSSVRVELQADCYAGVWAHSANARELLEMGDFEEAMHAAEAIGDDTLQQASGGVVRPESFTHGTSAQRMRWFQQGFRSGKPEACNTFGTSEL
jgi:predicted metalloprotease